MKKSGANTVLPAGVLRIEKDIVVRNGGDGVSLSEDQVQRITVGSRATLSRKIADIPRRDDIRIGFDHMISHKVQRGKNRHIFFVCREIDQHDNFIFRAGLHRKFQLDLAPDAQPVENLFFFQKGVFGLVRQRQFFAVEIFPVCRHQFRSALCEPFFGSRNFCAVETGQRIGDLVGRDRIYIIIGRPGELLCVVIAHDKILSFLIKVVHCKKFARAVVNFKIEKKLKKQLKNRKSRLKYK